MLIDRLQVAGINIHNGQALNLRVICDYLCPRTRTQPYHQNVRGVGMKCAEGVGSNDHVGVIQQVNLELPVVNSTSKERRIRGNSNYPTSVFDDLGEALCRIVCFE